MAVAASGILALRIAALFAGISGGNVLLALFVGARVFVWVAETFLVDELVAESH